MRALHAAPVLAQGAARAPYSRTMTYLGDGDIRTTSLSRAADQPSISFGTRSTTVASVELTGGHDGRQLSPQEWTDLFARHDQYMV